MKYLIVSFCVMLLLVSCATTDETTEEVEPDVIVVDVESSGQDSESFMADFELRY
jgi:AmiR/NasT family two-component response regulator